MTNTGIINARLQNALQTHKLLEFKEILNTCPCPLSQLREDNGCTLFHAIAAHEVIANESKAISFLQALVREYKDRYFKDCREEIKEALNFSRHSNGLTPLMLAIRNKRNVRKT